jgi:hypothetical protein
MENLVNTALERNMNTAVVKFVERVPNLLGKSVRITECRNMDIISHSFLFYF